MKTFKRFLSETSKIVDLMSKETLEPFANEVRNHIKKNHAKSEHIGNSDEGTYHKLSNNNDVMYYHMINNVPREISLIKNTDGVQSYVDKGKQGNSIHNKEFMKYHAKTVGPVISDKLQSKGSKQLWKDLVDTPPNNFTVYHHNASTNSLKKVDSDYLRDNEHKIWGSEEEHKNHRLALKYHE